MRKSLALVGPCFFVSGMTGLILEVVWNKELSYILGISLHSTATVVAAFMFGLALGALLIARAKLKIKNPVKAYAHLQLIIGLCGVVSIPVFRALKPLFFHLTGIFGSSGLFFLVKFLVLFFVMSIPVTLMGMTLPLITLALDRFKKKTEMHAGILYGINTLGAVSGCLIGGFLLIPNLGLKTSSIAAGLLDLFVGICLLASRPGRWMPEAGAGADATKFSSRESGRSITTTSSTAKSNVPWIVMGLFGVSGFFAMTYEVAWFRFLSNIFGATVDAFSMMLALFLIGIGLGSVVGAWLVGRGKSPLIRFAVLEEIIGLVTLYTLSIYNFIPVWYGKLFWTGGLFVSQIIISAIVVLPATFCMGALFPVVIQLISDFFYQDESHKIVGRVYLVNTLGSILGSIIAGFFIIPLLGYTHSIEVACLGSVILGIIAIHYCSELGLRKRIKSVAGLAVFASVLVLLVPAPDLLLLNQGIAMLMRNPEKFKDAVDGKQNEYQTLLYHRDGINESIAVIGNEANDGSIGLRVSAKNEANTSLFSRRHLLLLGQLPLFFSKGQEDVAVLGYGTGITTGAVLSHPAVKHVDILELEPAVIQASKYFNMVNGQPLNDRRSFVHMEDGRVYLSYTEKLYDVITTDPVSPWLAGSSNLYSKDFYQLMSKRLKVGGVFCQWVQMGDFSEDVYKTILSSVHGAFKNIYVFISTHDTVLLASNEPISIDWSEFQRRYDAGSVKDLLKEDEINSAMDLLSFYYAGTDQVERYLDGFSRINTDDNVWMETHLPFQLYSFHAGNFGDEVLTSLVPGRFASLMKTVAGLPLNEVADSLIRNRPHEFPAASPFIVNDVRQFLLSLGESSKASEIDASATVEQRDEELKRNYTRLIATTDSLMNNSELDNAEPYFREILKFRALRGFYPYGIKFVNLLIQRGKLSDALEVTHLLERNMPALPTAYILEVQILKQQGALSAVQEVLQRALLLNPDNHDLHDLFSRPRS